MLPTPPQQQTPELLPEEKPPQISPPAPIIPQEVPDTNDTFTVTGFEFDGNTVFSDEELAKVTKEFQGNITFAQLLQVASRVTEFYVKNGYTTSGAYIPAAQTLTGRVGTFKIQIVEGSLENINITGLRRLNSNYVRSRIAIATSKPLNINRLQEALQLLQLDPLIERVSAELSAGTRPGTNLLVVKIKEADSFQTKVSIDNSRNPSVGSFRRGVEITQANLLGMGDGLSVTYNNTDGSNAVDASYTLPINPRNGTLSFSYSTTKSNVIEEPFDKLDIEANSRTYEVTLRQPIVRNATPKGTQELAVGLTASRRESDTSLLGIDYPVSLGADAEGKTRISAIRFFQEWTQRRPQEVLAARSQFSLGVDAFNATVNDQGPDSRFFTWRGQMLWLRLLGSQNSDPRITPRLFIRSDVQLASTNLLPLEQFGLGGISSVRGYRQDALLTDNGVLISTELQWPIYSTPNRQNILQIIPFVDFGTTWNSSNRDAPNPNTLVSVGLGLQWLMGNNFKARLDYGIPLVDINSEKKTWQENGLYFSVQYNLF
ncbi:hemolysin activation/secretion protein [Oscillatoriales cyanobacterium USR001]|nr:hemolysin activation/secretion protein [Oscillatoriales cyanobacterium USR001]